MPDDASLLTRYATTRDAEAFAELVHRHGGLVHAACRRLCRHAADADDATQDTFIALARQAHHIHTSLPAWLHRVATRCAQRQHLRSRLAPLDDHPEPVSVEADRSQVEHLDAALATLGEDLREVLVLRFLLGRTQVEIADQLGLNQATVSRRLERGVARLRRLLSADESTMQAMLLPLVLPSVSTPPPHLIESLGRLALTGPPPVLPSSLWPLPSLAVTAAGLLAVVMLGGVIRGMAVATPLHLPLEAPPLPLAVADAQPPATDDQLSTVLDRPITLTMHAMSLATTVYHLNEQLLPARGDQLTLMPGDSPLTVIDPIDLAADHRPLHLVLDDLCHQSHRRWRSRAGLVVIDHPLPADQHARLKLALRDAISSALSSGDIGPITTVGDALITSGDADASADLLTALGDPRLADATAKGRVAVQDALLAALGRNPPALFDAIGGDQPLGLFADNEGCRRGVSRAWQRAAHGPATITPLLIALVGIGGISEAIPDLRLMLTSPERIASDLDPHGALQSWLLTRLRQCAIWSLGRLHDHASSEAIVTDLLRPGSVDALPCLDALQALGDPQVVDRVLAFKPGDLWDLQGAQYGAIACLAPAQLGELYPEKPPGAGEAHWRIPHYCLYAFNRRPSLALLPSLIGTTAPAQLSVLWSWLLSSIGHLPPGSARTVLEAHRRTVHVPGLLACIAVLQARAGDPQALEQVFSLLQHPTPELPQGFDWWAAQLTLTMPASDLTRCLAPWAGSAVTPTDELASQLLETSAPERVSRGWMAEFPSADQAKRQRILWQLSGVPSASDFLIARLHEDPQTLIAAVEVRNAGPRLLRSVVDMLDQPDPVVRRLAAHWLGSGVDVLDGTTAEHVLTAFDALPDSEVDAAMSRDLRPPHGRQALLPGIIEHEARLQLRWLTAPTPAVRSAAAFWLGIHLLLDFHPYRQQVITTLITRLASERDDSVLTQIRLALNVLISLSTAPSEYDGIGFQLLLSGCADDHRSLKALEMLRLDAIQALAAPASAAHTPKQNAGF